MFIKSLIIKNGDNIIRTLTFTKGLNLIIDDTSSENQQQTGNNVGKTTVLKLIDFCLGAQSKIVYTDAENKNEVDFLVKDFLEKNNIYVILTLVKDLDDPYTDTIEIQRNFLTKKKYFSQINGKIVSKSDFVNELSKLIFPKQYYTKPTFREIISYNCRYTNHSIDNALNTLVANVTKSIVYETLHLYWFGCPLKNENIREEFITELGDAKKLRVALSKEQNRTSSKKELKKIDKEIKLLNEKKDSFMLNPKWDDIFCELDMIKHKINILSNQIFSDELRKTTIDECISQLHQDKSNIDIKTLQNLYEEVSAKVANIQKDFEDLVYFHDNMLLKREEFMQPELIELNDKITKEKEDLKKLLKQEKELTIKLQKEDFLVGIDFIIDKLNIQYQLKGQYEGQINQLDEVKSRIKNIEDKVKKIEETLFSADFENILKANLDEFNKIFSEVSQFLYNESYTVSYEIKKNKSIGYQYYQFKIDNSSTSTGKKQGIILCFDLAHTLFADKKQTPVLHFLLNDKKELLHNNQLKQLNDFLKDKNIQVVASILKDKVPDSVLQSSNIAVRLSQDDKLFRIKDN